MKVRDPGRIFLRKGIRAAVAMPIVVALTLYVADDPRGAIFAGFAFYMWYRLAKDAWEKEVEALEEARAPVPSDHEGPPPAGD